MGEKIVQSHAQRKFMLFGGQHSLTAKALSLAVLALLFAAWASGQTPQSDCAKQSAAAHYTPIKSIDFSSKHNIMIKSQDGTLTPMDVPYYRSKLIAPGTWQIESDGDYSYLLEGDSEALAIDTGYGAGNIREYLQTLTSKPLRFVANTHDHFDHTANDAYFDCAYMSAETAKKATIPFQSFDGVNFPRDYPKVIVGDGYKIQLGNREVDVFIIPNHTAGGTAYLDKRERIMFSGDEIFQGNITISATGSVAQYERNMSKLEAHRSEFDRLATGGFGVIDATWVDKFLANTQYILAGHEGEPATPQQRRPAPPSDPSAPLTYNRRFPRPGDSAERNSNPSGPNQPGPPQANENLRKMTYDGCGITYDIRHIQG
jgi:glyoxylase-like metal-dependent hydrolase (beta-lactamase superfamily II)